MMITRIEAVALSAVGVLFTLWPVPRTTSIRDALLFLSCIGFIVLARRAWRQARIPFAAAVPASALLAALTLWMFVVALWISRETAWSLDEIRGQWLKGLVAYALGIAAALSIATRPELARRALLGLAAILLLHVIAIDVTGIGAWFVGDFSARAAGLTGGPDKSSYLTNIFFAFLFTELLLRWRRRENFLPVPNALLYTATALALLSVVAERTRNGLLTLVVMFVVAAVLAGRLSSAARKLSPARIVVMVAVLTLSVALALAALSFKPGGSLRKAIDTVPIALDTVTHKAWLDLKRYPYPTLPNGEPVDESAYMRIAWLKEGMSMVAQDPLGRGFGRNAFGHGLLEKYGEGKGHSHSGLLDLAIGVGVPGTILWLGFLASLLALAGRSVREAPDPYAILLLLLTADFGARMLVDSVIRDHMLQMFLFLAGLLATLIAARTPNAPGR